MQNDTISAKKMLCIILLFIFGSSVVMGVCGKAEQDAWISVLIALVIAIPVVLVYARIMKLYPEKDLYDIFEELFGKIAGKIFILLITWYAMHLGSMVLRNFSEFIQVVSMPQTPQLVLMIVMLSAAMYLAKSGVRVMGKWAIIIITIVGLVVIFTVLLSLNTFDYTNLLPVMSHDSRTIVCCSFNVFAFPLAEIVLFLTLGRSIKKEDSPYKLFLYAVLFGALILITIVLRNILALGPATMANEYFPSYTAARILKIADFLQRIEGLISVNFIFAGLTKIAVCLLAASKGIAKVFNIQNHKAVMVPVTLLLLALSTIVFENTMDMFNFTDIYTIYAIPFEVIIPLLVWVTAEIKTRKKKNTASA